MSFEGEVQPCRDPWHTDLAPETKAALEAYYAHPVELDPQDDADFGHAMGLDNGD